jgi:hypothetical protein
MHCMSPLLTQKRTGAPKKQIDASMTLSDPCERPPQLAVLLSHYFWMSAFGPFADVGSCAANVRDRGQSRHHLLQLGGEAQPSLRSMPKNSRCGLSQLRSDWQ